MCQRHPHVTLRLRLSNCYEDGFTDVHEEFQRVPEPTVADARAEFQRWAYEYLYPFTGVGRSGPAIYTVTVLSGPIAGLKGRRFEWVG